MHLLAVLGRPYLVENEASSSFVLSRLSESSSTTVAGEEEVKNRWKKCMEDKDDEDDEDGKRMERNCKAFSR